MKTKAKASFLVKWMYDRIPNKAREAALEGKSILRGGSVRLQSSIPQEHYVVLGSLGAFSSSESNFITELCTEYIERRMKDLELIEEAIPGLLAHREG